MVWPTLNLLYIYIYYMSSDSDPTKFTKIIKLNKRKNPNLIQYIVAEREPRWVFRVNIVSLGTEKEIGTDMYVCMYVCILYCTVSQNDCSFRLYLKKY